MIDTAFQRKLTDGEISLINQCEKIKFGDTKLQSYLETKGLRQFTNEEIEIANALMNLKIGRFKKMKDLWMHIPFHRYDYIEMIPSTIIKMAPIKDRFFLVELITEDDRQLKLQWVVELTDGEFLPRFDAKPFLGRRN